MQQFSVTFHPKDGMKPWEDPEILVIYLPYWDSYGLLVRDGEPTYISIKACPWCRTPFNKPLRDEWFAELRRRGFDPESKDIPEEFKTSAWRTKTV